MKEKASFTDKQKLREFTTTKPALLLRRKALTNLDSVLKSRDITLPTKVCRVKAEVSLVVMYVWM